MGIKENEQPTLYMDTKIWAVLDASSKSSTGVSLNDTLLDGPTVHSSLVDVLLRFHFHRIALTSDISCMYYAVKLVLSDLTSTVSCEGQVPTNNLLNTE